MEPQAIREKIGTRISMRKNRDHENTHHAPRWLLGYFLLFLFRVVRHSGFQQNFRPHLLSIRSTMPGGGGGETRDSDFNKFAQRLRLEKDWIVPIHWCWITEPPLGHSHYILLVAFPEAIGAPPMGMGGQIPAWSSQTLWLKCRNLFMKFLRATINQKSDFKSVCNFQQIFIWIIASNIILII